MNDKKISAEESIEIIQGMIALARNKFDNSGFHFILWGGLVIITSLLLYFLNYSNETSTYHWLWALVPVLGFPIAYLYESRKNNHKQKYI